MFTKLSDTSKAPIFSVLVLVMAVGAALLIRMLDLTSGMGMWVLWSFTPTAATLVMLLVVTREGYTREGWKGLGLHRLGLSVWWIAFGGTLLISVAASAVVWATPLASFVVPEGGIVDRLISFLVQVVILALTFALGEEIGIRGYLARDKVQTSPPSHPPQSPLPELPSTVMRYGSRRPIRLSWFPLLDGPGSGRSRGGYAPTNH